MYRNLTQTEITKLLERGCYAKDWNCVKVKCGTLDTSRYTNVRFSGTVLLGEQNGEIELAGGISTLTGIKNVLLHNCTVGDNVYINNVTQYIANYTLCEGVIINNIDCLIANEGSTFGNGTEVSVLNETGGRDVKIYDKLSSQVAYVMALYRHRQDLISQLTKLIDNYIEKVRSEGAVIGRNTKILNTGEMIDLRVGEGAVINGASRLVDGSINSTINAPSVIGRGVIAEHFIISDSTSVIDGSIIDKCFVGQGTEIGKQFSAENTLFFANCVAMHGEACALLGGPYTVSHHKSTLLIAAMTSFMNAGSGSNQSNHMYKLGPLHQGVLGRGAKTTSGSYILWPMKVGAFSLVMGRHYNNADLSDMPFSYIIEETSGSTTLVPGVNLRSVGTIRDAKKWPRRDKRKGELKLDQINFNLLSPYTIGKMLKGEELLGQMISLSGETSERYIYQSCSIRRSAAVKGLKYYNAGVTKFLGNSLLKRLEGVEWKSIEQIRERLHTSQEIGEGTWSDIAGLLCPKSEVSKLLDKLEHGEVESVEHLLKLFEDLNTNYYEYEWNWAVALLCERIGKNIDSIEISDLVSYAKEWQRSVVELDKELYNDAHKEFNLITTTSFGIDGGKETREKDFIAVRGEFAKNDFVMEVLTHIEKKTALAEEFIQRISKINS